MHHTTHLRAQYHRMRCLGQVQTEEEERRLIMIKTNELRVLDLVKIKTSNDAAYYPIYAIDVIHQKVILGGARECEGWKDISLLKPIPLTEGILTQYGFVKDQFGSYHKDNIEIYFSHGVSFGIVSNTPIHNLKSLHHLQNIYFGLTNKELEIEL